MKLGKNSQDGFVAKNNVNDFTAECPIPAQLLYYQYTNVHSKLKILKEKFDTLMSALTTTYGLEVIQEWMNMDPSSVQNANNGE